MEEKVIKSILPHEDIERDVAYEHAHIAHLNIFKPVHGKRDQVVRVSGEYGEAKSKQGKTTIEVMMPNQLSIEDEDLLLALYSIARPVHHTTEVQTKDAFYKLPKTKFHASTVNVVTNKYRLLKMLKKESKGGKAYADLLKSLKRLAEPTALKTAPKLLN